MIIPMKPIIPRRRGFSLTELLVAVAIIIIVAILGMAAARRAVAGARSARCVSNLRDLGAAALAYTSENNGYLPPICQLTYGKAWSAEAATRWWPSFLANSSSKASEMVYHTWRCPEVRDSDFQIEGSAGLVYSSYTPLRPLVSFIEANNPYGGMLLAAVQRPEKVWMFGDGGRAVGATNKEGTAERYETVGAMQRYGKSWATSARPVCRHDGGRKSHYVACDGHVESLTKRQIDDINNGAFGNFNGNKVEY